MTMILLASCVSVCLFWWTSPQTCLTLAPAHSIQTGQFYILVFAMRPMSAISTKYGNVWKIQDCIGFALLYSI